MRYQVTDLTWLWYYGHLAEFGYSKYLIAPLLPVRFGGTSDSFGQTNGYFGSTTSHKSTNQDLNKFAWYAAEGTWKSKSPNDASFFFFFSGSIICAYRGEKWKKLIVFEMSGLSWWNWQKRCACVILSSHASLVHIFKHFFFEVGVRARFCKQRNKALWDPPEASKL